MALLGGAARHSSLPPQEPAASDRAMQTRWVSELATPAPRLTDAAAARIQPTGLAAGANTGPEQPPASSPQPAQSETTLQPAGDLGARNQHEGGTQVSPQGAGEQRLDARAFLASDQLEWPPMPYSAPDSRVLDGVGTSGLPLKARLLIDADGVVQDLLPLQAVLDQDQPWFAQLRAMFIQTRFTPGRLEGRAVAASLDLDIKADPEPGLQ